MIFKNCPLSMCVWPRVGDREALEPPNGSEMGRYRKPDRPLAGFLEEALTQAQKLAGPLASRQPSWLWQSGVG